MATAFQGSESTGQQQGCCRCLTCSTKEACWDGCSAQTWPAGIRTPRLFFKLRLAQLAAAIAEGEGNWRCAGSTTQRPSQLQLRRGRAPGQQLQVLVPVTCTNIPPERDTIQFVSALQLPLKRAAVGAAGSPPALEHRDAFNQRLLLAPAAPDLVAAAGLRTSDSSRGSSAAAATPRLAMREDWRRRGGAIGVGAAEQPQRQRAGHQPTALEHDHWGSSLEKLRLQFARRLDVAHAGGSPAGAPPLPLGLPLPCAA